MQPTLNPGERIIADKISYKLGKYNDGDIALFKSSDKILIKRIYKIDSQHFVAYGDNSSNSYDSRYFGKIDNNLLIGKAMFRYWPLNKIGFIEQKYNKGGS